MNRSTQSSVHAHAATLFFFFNDTATTEIYTLSLHDALPIYQSTAPSSGTPIGVRRPDARSITNALTSASSYSSLSPRGDRKSTRLNSSHVSISYAVFCLKKKKTMTTKNH